MIIKYVFFIYVFCFSAIVFSQSELPYDEIVNKKGKIRKQYKVIFKIFKNLSDERIMAIEKSSLEDFSGDNSIRALPRVLTVDEGNLLDKGLRQRAEAIRMLLEEYHSGGTSWKKVIPKRVLEKIIDRNGEASWKGYVRPKEIEFWYGPDIIRGPDGKFYVIEDNPGFIGGMGDLIQARETIEKNIPEYYLLNSPHPSNFYDKLAEKHILEAKKNNGVAVLLSYAAKQSADKEDKRLAQIFEDRGVYAVRNFTWSKNKSRAKRKLVVKKDGVWLHIKKKKGKTKKLKVGSVILNMEVLDVDPGFIGNRHKRLLVEASDTLAEKGISKFERKKLNKLIIPNKKTGKIDFDALESFLRNDSEYNTWLDKRMGIEGFWQAYHDGKVNVSYSPGVDFIGDKEFYIYVEDLIKHYLKEEPIIKNIYTRSFRMFKNGKGALDKEMLLDIIKHIDRYVIKGVDGRGGDAVWIGSKMKKKKLKKLVKKIKKDPAAFILQLYTQLSTEEDFIVDLRLLSAVFRNGAITSDVPWGRAVSMLFGNGKVNLSDKKGKGTETLVLIDFRKKLSCNDIILPFL